MCGHHRNGSAIGGSKARYHGKGSATKCRSAFGHHGRATSHTREWASGLQLAPDDLDAARKTDMADTEIIKRHFIDLRRYVNLERDNARSGHSGLVWSFMSIDFDRCGNDCSWRDGNFSVNSRAAEQ
jgi:hypothetical protein